MTNNRFPTMENSLETLVRFGVPVNSILDVGVQGGTKPLMAVFPDLPHYLFEPVDAYFNNIRNAYKNYRHELIHVALSDEDGKAWQVGISRDNSGKVTHSWVSDREVSTKEEAQLVECKPIRKAKLDTVMQTLSLPAGPWLLKVDVDGHEIPILRGAEKTLRNTSVVVVEAPLHTMLARSEVLLNAGFQLFDIVDLSYYYGTLSQVDLVFVRQDLVNANAELRPWQTKTFAWEAWRPLNHTFFCDKK